MHIHTDLGHDPDDAVAVAYLLESGVNIECISITPGHFYQLRAVSGLLEMYGARCRYLLTSKVPKKPYQSKTTGKHVKLYSDKRVHGHLSLEGSTFIEECNRMLIIGPAINLAGRFKAEMLVSQGGYSPNSINPLPKFQGKTHAPSFNPNGAPKDFKAISEDPNIYEKYYVGKNVCHGFTKAHMEKIWRPSNPKFLPFYDQLYPDKAMHDVLAAMCMRTITENEKLDLVWEDQKPIRERGGYTTIPCQPGERIKTLIGINDGLLKNHV